ncbi:MAG TPA: nucleotidyltransferase family protein, partial [Bryobacteraceae bacterium]|nr:nucleotidyltransferase family protein [Bryobacteraceae bacterium]
MWGIIPAAGKGSRIQPLAFSKELLPVGARNRDGRPTPRAVSDYLIERLVLGGANRICFVISPGKSDILEYYGGAAHGIPICYCVQPEPLGLCDAIFRAAPLIAPTDSVLVGLPDTIWFPATALGQLRRPALEFLLFPVENPERFDAVIAEPNGRVREIHVKLPAAGSNWVWGAFRMPGSVFHDLFSLWLHRRDEYIGTLVNAWIEGGGEAWSEKAGSAYFDVGAMEGYIAAVRLLSEAEMT